MLHEIDSQYTIQEDTLIEYGLVTTPFGYGLIGMLKDSLCALSLSTSQSKNAFLLKHLKTSWNGAHFKENTPKCKHLFNTAFNAYQKRQAPSISYTLKGTAFQRSVWKVLLQLPAKPTHYQTIAEAIGNPRAMRAVGSAVGANPIAIFIPCHRILPKKGGIGGFAWGCKIKEQLLSYEREW